MLGTGCCPLPPPLTKMPSNASNSSIPPTRAVLWHALVPASPQEILRSPGCSLSVPLCTKSKMTIVCLCVCVYIHVRVCMCTCACLYVYMCMFVCVHVHVCVCPCVCLRVYTCALLCVCMCTCVLVEAIGQRQVSFFLRQSVPCLCCHCHFVYFGWGGWPSSPRTHLSPPPSPSLRL